MSDNNQYVIEKIQQKTVVAQVMEKIRQLIANGQYRVHDKIPTEAELSQMFGVGRSSIREAIKIFNYLGILESQAAKGTFVSDRTSISSEALTWSILLGQDDLFELLEVRGSLELWSILNLQARFKADPESVRPNMEKIEAYARIMEEAVHESMGDKFVKADFNFHCTLIEAGGNSLFASIYRTLSAFVQDAMAKTRKYGRKLEDTYNEHMEILKVIKSGERTRAIELVQSHFSHVKKSLSYLVQK